MNTQKRTTMSNHKISILGSGGVGKSSLTLHFVSGQKPSDIYDPTIEDTFIKMLEVDKSPTRLELLDTAGQEEFHSLMDDWIRGGEAYLLVYAVNDPLSFEFVQETYEKILRVEEDRCDAQGLDVVHLPSVVLVANKVDLPEDEQKVSKQQGQDFAQKNGMTFLETSAMTGLNNKLCFEECVRILRKGQANQAILGKKKHFNPKLLTMCRVL
jgi:GTPase KRas protein